MAELRHQAEAGLAAQPADRAAGLPHQRQGPGRPHHPRDLHRHGGRWRRCFSPYDPYRRAGKPHMQPSVEHFLGTSRQGKDVFTQLLEGGRTSLTVGFVAGLSATLIGLAVGISAGYFGGRTDEILTFFVNVVAGAAGAAADHRLCLLHRGGVADRDRPRPGLYRLGLERAHHPHPDPRHQDRANSCSPPS